MKLIYYVIYVLIYMSSSMLDKDQVYMIYTGLSHTFTSFRHLTNFFHPKMGIQFCSNQTSWMELKIGVICIGEQLRHWNVDPGQEMCKQLLVMVSYVWCKNFISGKSGKLQVVSNQFKNVIVCIYHTKSYYIVTYTY